MIALYVPNWLVYSTFGLLVIVACAIAFFVWVLICALKQL